MKACIINIGDELLIGQVTNFNASWIATQLNALGIEVVAINVVSDRQNEISAAIDKAAEKADLVMLTGGLGPTNDDITKNVLCAKFKLKLVFSNEVFRDIKKLFAQRKWKLSALNKKQAEVPRGSKVIRNKYGTAPGIWITCKNKIFIAVPGVPFEMKGMMSDTILPSLGKMVKGQIVVHKTILTQGIGESSLAEMISSWEVQLPSFIRLAYLPSPGLVRLRLSAYGKDRKMLNAEISRQTKKILPLISDIVFGYDDETLESLIGHELIERGKTLSLAESCTGGFIAHRITSVAGSSAYFKGSIVSYSNESKVNFLGVKQATLLKHGAVSEQTVIEMAANCRKKFHADYAIAVSGIAGPDGGTKDKPVGTVWIAVASAENISAYHFLFGNLRMVNIERAAVTALHLLLKEIRRR